MKRFIIATIIFAIVAIGGGIYYYEGTLPAQESNNEKVTIVIPKGSTVNDIIKKLDDEDLIRNRLVFFVLVKQMGIESNIQAGSFRLSPSMSAREIATELTQGTDDVWITVIEGLRKEEIAQIIAEDLSIPESEFIDAAEEGKLFPDTYLVPQEATIQTILNVFRQNYDNKFTQELKDKAAANGLSENEVLTLASMIEREANSPDTMQKVASILLKRLELGMPLQVDATLQYALGYQESEKTWWPEPRGVDKEVDSPYNTYQNPGLPPGPIASPGLNAIVAVVEADPSTPYLYYISNKDGSELIYAETYDEHLRNIDRYLR